MPKKKLSQKEIKTQIELLEKVAGASKKQADKLRKMAKESTAFPFKEGQAASNIRAYAQQYYSCLEADAAKAAKRKIRKLEKLLQETKKTAKVVRQRKVFRKSSKTPSAMTYQQLWFAPPAAYEADEEPGF